MTDEIVSHRVKTNLNRGVGIGGGLTAAGQAAQREPTDVRLTQACLAVEDAVDRVNILLDLVTGSGEDRVSDGDTLLEKQQPLPLAKLLELAPEWLFKQATRLESLVSQLYQALGVPR